MIDSSKPETVPLPEPWEKAFALFLKYAESKYAIGEPAPSVAKVFRAGYLAGLVDSQKKETESNDRESV